MFQVLLQTSGGLRYEGWVYTIDPVTQTWVLMNPSNTPDSSQPVVHLVMNSAVTNTEVVDSDCPESISILFQVYSQSKKVCIRSCFDIYCCPSIFY